MQNVSISIVKTTEPTILRTIALYSTADCSSEERPMSKRIAYPRSSAQPIYLTASVLGLLGLAGVIVMLIAMADVPKQSYYLLIAAFGLLVVALAGALAVLLATNTRRPWGIDPNLGSHYSIPPKAEADPFGSSTEELLRHAVQLPDGNGYGRRRSDDRTVVQRLAIADRPLPPNPPRPAWVDEMLPPAFQEEPPKELTPPFTEIPLDQLDLVPAAHEATNQKDERVDTGGTG
jgi:hypothetical protein